MLFASVRMAPPGGRLRGFSRDAIAALPGVRHVAARDEWIAVVGDSWWAAERALEGRQTRSSPASERRPTCGRCSSMRCVEGERSNRSAAAIMQGRFAGSRPLAATYYAAPSQHLGLEPVSATARVNGANVEVWAATPGAGPRHARSCRCFYPMPAGEPAGRAMEADAVPDRGRAGARAEAPGAGRRCRRARARTTTGSRPARWRG